MQRENIDFCECRIGEAGAASWDNSAMTNKSNLKTTSDASATPAASGAAVKNLYEVGEIPPLGHVPKEMYAWAIRA